MTKTHLLQAACAVAMLAATPALAQRPEAGMTGPNGQPNPAAAHPAPAQPAPATGSVAPANDGADTTSMVTPNGTHGSGSQYTHRAAMAHDSSAMHGHASGSQNNEVDRLNDQSYQAAQQGQAFKVGSSDMGAPRSSSAGSMSNPGGTDAK